MEAAILVQRNRVIEDGPICPDRAAERHCRRRECFERAMRPVYQGRMAWRGVIALFMILAHLCALAIVSVPVQAAPVMMAMPCHDGDLTTEGEGESSAWQRLPCCAPVCCIGVSVPEVELAGPLFSRSPAPVPSPLLASVTVGPGDRPPKV